MSSPKPHQLQTNNQHREKHGLPGASNRAMSQGQDDYAETPQPSGHSAPRQDSEPADPHDPDHHARRELPLAPEYVKTEDIPDPLISDNGPVQTVGKAGKTYLKVQRSNWNSNALTSKYERHRFEIYPRILNADRQLQASYDGLTTAMLTRRLSPLDSSDRWLTPWECNEMLHGGGIHRSVNRVLRGEFEAFEFEWVAVTAPTESAGTPHEHIYLWIDDPDDAITAEYLKPGLDKHLKNCTNAYEEDHRYRSDGTSGAITVQQQPELRREMNQKVAKQVIRGNTAPRPNTAGAQYLASQLVHLHIGDFYNANKTNPPKPLFQGAALAWANQGNWLRSSVGMPL